ncbi:MAG: signal peptidase I [Candidatus Shapirobacteria bacterium]|jgi:signal peptidase
MKVIYYLSIVIWFLVCLLTGVTGRELVGKIRIDIISSGSMEPTIRDGSVVVIVPKAEYKKGEIISFWAKTENGAQIITHRVDRIGGNVYVTRGDMNKAVDEPVEPRLVIGKVVAIIPWIGNLIEIVKSRTVIKIMIILPSGLIIINELIKIWRLTKK